MERYSGGEIWKTNRPNSLQEKGRKEIRESQWRRDLMVLGDSLDNTGFTSVISNNIGDGVFTLFWKIQWSGHEAFRDIFPTLYQYDTNDNNNVSNMGCWVGNTWEWKFDNCFSIINAEATSKLADLKVVQVHVASSGYNKDLQIWQFHGS